MKKVLTTVISVFLMGWVLSAPLLISAHSTLYHSRLGGGIAGLCMESCSDTGHRNPNVKHDWCQVRVFSYVKDYVLPIIVSFRNSSLVPPIESSPHIVSLVLLPPARASPVA